jgi:hypothetical protein
MKLVELQRRFCDSVRDEQASHGLPFSGDGMRVYRNNYCEQLRSALRTSFPYLALWLGDLEFDRAADAQIALYSPTSWTLDHYGHDFPSTLQALYPQEPEVAELAWLDWAMAEALVAQDERSLDTARLAAVDWDSASIRFVSSLRISEARSNAGDIWAALEEQSPPPLAALSPARHALLVWRRGLVPCFRSVPSWELQMVEALKHGFGFAGACEILRLRFGAEPAIDAAAATLARWLSDDLIASVEADAAVNV